MTQSGRELRIEIVVGSLASPLHEQIGCEAVVVEAFQAQLDALNLLRVHEIIPEGVAWLGAERVILKEYGRNILVPPKQEKQDDGGSER